MTAVTAATVMVWAMPVPNAVTSFQNAVRWPANHTFTPRSAEWTGVRSMT